MPQVRRTDGEALCQARQQPGQTLLELQQLVGGNIELVDLGKKYLVLDEEGKLKGKMVNLIATGWLQQEGIHDFAVGTALLIDKKHLK